MNKQAIIAALLALEYYISHISYKPKSLIYNDNSIIFLSP